MVEKTHWNHSRTYLGIIAKVKEITIEQNKTQNRRNPKFQEEEQFENKIGKKCGEHFKILVT